MTSLQTLLSTQTHHQINRLRIPFQINPPSTAIMSRSSPERRRSPSNKFRGSQRTHKRYNSESRRSLDDRSEDSLTAIKEWGIQEAQRCDDGDPDLELCELPEVIDSIPPLERTTLDEAFSRGRWLVGLLVLQSSSSFILDSYQELIKQHLVVTLFLTMLVGAGGNAGNQSAIKVIRGLATGMIKSNAASFRKVMQQQALVALLLGTGLSAVGWLRVYITNGDALNSTAISMALFLIVCTSVLFGAALPFGLAKFGVDPANAGTSIQVLMDCLGVLITCVCCHYVLDIYSQGVGIVTVAASAVVS